MAAGTNALQKSPQGPVLDYCWYEIHAFLIYLLLAVFLILRLVPIRNLGKVYEKMWLGQRDYQVITNIFLAQNR